MSINEDVLSSFDTEEAKNAKVPKKLTVLPLRDVIIFPYMIFPVLIGRTSSLKAVAEAIERDKYIFVSAQKDSETEDPGFNDIYEYGTTARILQVLRLPNNLIKVLVEGLFIGKIKKKYKTKEFMEAEIQRIIPKYDEENKEYQAASRHAHELFVSYIKQSNNLPTDLITAFESMTDPLQKLYFGIANTRGKIERKQKCLEYDNLKDMNIEFVAMLNEEIEILKLESAIDVKVNESIQKNQKKYIIMEQIRALQNELGENEESSPDLMKIREMLDKAELPEKINEKADEEFERLRKTPTMSPEFTVSRNYLEWLASVPWNKSTQDNFNIEHVKKILDEDHYDLEKPKERILEFIAVLNLSGKLKRQILCFVGPPGVGKTSLAKSIAKALCREYVRFSLGGVRDEAEIRGHRKTYIGAMPGKIIQSMKKAGTNNPVILLDEIDKMSMDFRGDPSSALLEVLDPEQNIAFNDHYLEVDYDLSNVLFITTANVMYDIPLPLLDRMEIIELNSYLDPDKLQIAKRHIMPKLFEEYGLDKIKINFTDEALLKLISQYTRESGVRNLEREIASILRKLAKDIVIEYDNFIAKSSKKVSDKKTEDNPKLLLDRPEFVKFLSKKSYSITPDLIEKYLKAPKFKRKKENLEDKVGVATGLAWTSVGGEILPIEVTIMPGAEKLTLTGKLGDVMKESAAAALSFIRANYSTLGVKENFNKNKEIHIHVPEGAIPKDGPSAGITMALALISAATGNPLRGDLAMTGEITLRGNILPIGGLKEKLLAAKRIGVNTVLVPKENERDIVDISDEIKNDLDIHFIKHLSEAMPIAFKKSKSKVIIKK